MELNVHEQATHARRAVRRAQKQTRRAHKRARRRTLDAVDVVRAIDVHEPAQVAKAAAAKAAKHAAKRASKEAASAAARVSKQKSRRAARRLTRVGLTAVAAGALVAVTVVMIRHMRAGAGPDDATRESFDGADANEGHPTDRSTNGAATRSGSNPVATAEHR